MPDAQKKDKAGIANFINIFPLQLLHISNRFTIFVNDNI